MLLSIIIPTFNEEKLLPNLLRSIEEQSFKDLEVVVADNNSTDDTNLIALKSKAKVVKGGMPSDGRNNGAKSAQGEWLLFLDADVILPPNFLEEAFIEIKKQNFCVASCLVEPISDKKIDKFLHNTVNWYMKAVQKFSPHVSGSCIFIKKEIHQSIKGFDEKMKLAEDHDYISRASKVAKFGFLQGVRIPISVRRLEKDGRFNIAVKYLAVEAHLLFFGPIYSNVFNYEFGYSNKKLGNRKLRVK